MSISSKELVDELRGFAEGSTSARANLMRDAATMIEVLIYKWDESQTRLTTVEQERDGVQFALDMERANHKATVQSALATGWWEGTNDQWKHCQIGNRLSEFRNPYAVTAEKEQSLS